MAVSHSHVFVKSSVVELPQDLTWATTKSSIADILGDLKCSSHDSRMKDFVAGVSNCAKCNSSTFSLFQNILCEEKYFISVKSSLLNPTDSDSSIFK